MLRLLATPRRRAAALIASAAGAALVYGVSADPLNGTSVSASAPLRRLLALTATGLFPVDLSSQHFFSVAGFPIHSASLPGNLPPAVSDNPTAGKSNGGANCCGGCLGRNSIAVAAAAASPAVVNLSVSLGDYFHGLLLEKSIASGTIIDPDGTILTCAHVFADYYSPKGVSNRKVGVTLQDGRQFEGVVLNIDRHSDIAVVKIKSKTPLPAAKLGSSSALRPGDWVVALGCPLSLQNTVTAGIVSCVDRKSSDLGLGGLAREYLQTDCAINQGSSGGPLVNLDGEVIGVNVMKVVAADGLSFAVPIDSVSKIIEHFKRNGRVIRPWLGLKMLDLNPSIVQQLKERDASFPDVEKGVLVPMIVPGSPAERAGFRPGDVVVEFSGQPVRSVKEIIDIMGDKVGVAIPVVLLRGNKSVFLNVTPVESDADK